MIVLGINSYFEHPATAIVADGAVAFAVEDERFTGIKHGRRYSPHRAYLPVDAMYASLVGCGLTAWDLDEIGYSYDRWLHLRSLWGCLTGRRLASLRDELNGFMSATNVRQAMLTGYEIPYRYRQVLDPRALGQIKYTEWNHHLSHAASSFFCSSFDEALVVVCDGSGERAATSVYVGRRGKLTLVARIDIPHSLGIFYSMVTRHLGFEPFSDEYKVMGLAAYGEPRYGSEFRSILEITEGGGYRVDIRALQDLSPLLGPPRLPGSEIEQRHMDIAQSAQGRLESALKHLIGHHVRTTGLERVCLAGGTFLNCVANGQLARLKDVADIFVQPAAHDGGTAIGAAALSWVRRGGDPRLSFGSAGLGTVYADDHIERVLRRSGVMFETLGGDVMRQKVAALLADSQIGGLFRGRMEFGPRSLGMRSILASPLDPSMRDRLNILKGRESFRPVAPVVTKEAFNTYFDGRRDRYMLFTAGVRAEARHLIPAAVHVDGSARVQTVDASEDPYLHDLLVKTGELTGVPVLINTSLNVRGRPIAESPHEALSCLYTTDMDFLVMGDSLVTKRATV